MLLSITNTSVSLAGETILDHIDFEIKGKEKIAVIGRNGAGKTTLLKLIAGELSPDRNEKDQAAGLRTSRSLTIEMLPQDPLAEEQRSVREWIEAQISVSGKPEEAAHEADMISSESSRERQADPTEKEYYRTQAEFRAILTGLGFSLTDLDKPAADFSGGWRTRLALAGLIFREPDILLLDEPTNHLDNEACEWLENYLKSYPKAVVMVSHDRYFMDETAEIVYEIEKKKLIKYNGNYSAYIKEKARRYQAAVKEYRKQKAEEERLTALIEKFKTKPRKAAFARTRKKLLSRMEKPAAPDASGRKIRIRQKEPHKPGPKCVFDIKELVTGYDPAHPQKRISMRINRGSKIGIFGPNGSGKSTWIKTLAGMIPKIAGRCVMGEGIDAAYYDQLSTENMPDGRVLEVFRKQFPGYTEQEARSILAGYLFSSKDVGKKLTDLSGGEKARFTLMMILESGPNLLLLDEPTNHLDIPAREIFEDMLLAYSGTLLFVTHDRYFLKKCAQSLLYFPPEDAPVRFFPYDYDHYVVKHAKGARGENLSAERMMYEEAMVESLRAVPKRERHEIRVSTETAHTDWKLGMCEEEMEAAADQLEQLYEKYRIPPAWMEEAERKAAEQKFAAAEKRYTRACIDWYETWASAEDSELSF